MLVPPLYKIFLFAGILLSSNAMCMAYLDPSQRDDSLKIQIQQTFDRISSNKQNWNFNGATSYTFVKIDPKTFIETIIKASPTQKDFYILDIGAGDFSWGISTAKYLNEKNIIPEGVTVHVISVTGDNYGGNTVSESGRCKLYNIDAFKIEDLRESLDALKKTLNLNIDNKIDLIVSRYTFIHLHDPVGVFVQAYNLLRPKGLMLMDGFPVLFGNSDPQFYDPGLIELLQYTGESFLVGPKTNDRGTSTFLLERMQEEPLQLPLKYGGTIKTKFSSSFEKMTAYYIPLFEVKTKNLRHAVNFNSTDTIYGDRYLYREIYMHYPYWKTITTKWTPLFADDNSSQIIRKPDPLFEAVDQGNIPEVKRILLPTKSSSRSVNEKDVVGTPLLHKTYNIKMLEFLLSYPGVDVNAQDSDGRTMLHICAYNAFLPIVEALIKHGADVNKKDNNGNTPLQAAIAQKEMGEDVVHLLREKGAK